MKITGITFYYYFVCKRKMWLFSNGISYEEENKDVLLGKMIDEDTHKKEDKHIMIDETINIDFLRKWKILYEVKKDRSIEEATIWQVKYYLYFLKNKGINIEYGKIDYPKLKKIINVKLNLEDIEKIKDIEKDINNLLERDTPPKIDEKRYCKKCAYYEYCFVGSEDI